MSKYKEIRKTAANPLQPAAYALAVNCMSAHQQSLMCSLPVHLNVPFS